MIQDSDEVLDHFATHCDVTSAVEHGNGESTKDGTKAVGINKNLIHL